MILIYHLPLYGHIPCTTNIFKLANECIKYTNGADRTKYINEHAREKYNLQFQGDGENVSVPKTHN